MKYYYQPVSTVDDNIKRLYRVLPDGTVQHFSGYSAWQPLLFPVCFHKHVGLGIIKALDASTAAQYELDHSAWRTT